MKFAEEDSLPYDETGKPMLVILPERAKRANGPNRQNWLTGQTD